MKRSKAWECHGCGHRMTATTEVREGGLVADDDLSEAVPQEMDLCVCMNCGALYEVRSGEWERLSEEEIPHGYRKTVKRMRRALKKAIPVDLTMERKLRGLG